MDYASYVSRRPPSPPPLPRIPYQATPSLSTKAPPPSEYSLLHDVVVSSSVETEQEKHELMRIRLENMLTVADEQSERVLRVALEKCNAKLDAVADEAKEVELARNRMRDIESRNLVGEGHAWEGCVEREKVAGLVEQIEVCLHDQVRIHFLAGVLRGKLGELMSAFKGLAEKREVVDDRKSFVGGRSKSFRTGGVVLGLAKRAASYNIDGVSCSPVSSRECGHEEEEEKVGWMERLKGRFGRARMRRLWKECNDLYLTVATHAPHLVERGVVPRGTLAVGVLGEFKKGGRIWHSVQAASVAEAVRRVEGIVEFQQKLVVEIRKDMVMWRRRLHEKDAEISRVYLKR